MNFLYEERDYIHYGHITPPQSHRKIITAARENSSI